MTNLGGLIHKVAHKMKREIDHANQKLGVSGVQGSMLDVNRKIVMFFKRILRSISSLEGHRLHLLYKILKKWVLL